MAQDRDVVILVGSLRKDSFTRKAAKAVAALSPPHVKFRFVEIGDLPFYNQDLETDAPPAAWTRFRNDVKNADAVLFATPEYNRTIPAVLKNAVDVGSRPYGQSVFNDKPAAVLSVSPGAIGGFGANHHLRQAIAFLNMPILQQPEAYLGNAPNLFDAEGALTDEKASGFLQGFADAFAAWIERTAAK